MEKWWKIISNQN